MGGDALLQLFGTAGIATVMGGALQIVLRRMSRRQEAAEARKTDAETDHVATSTLLSLVEPLRHELAALRAEMAAERRLMAAHRQLTIAHEAWDRAVYAAAVIRGETVATPPPLWPIEDTGTPTT